MRIIICLFLLCSTACADEATYYFNSYDVALRVGDPWVMDEEQGLIADGNIETYTLYTGADFVTWDSWQDLLDENTCAGTSLGTITKVELRWYGSGSGPTVGAVLTPIFDYSLGDAYETLSGNPAHGSPGWSVYHNITNSTNAPVNWGWDDVKNLTVGIASPIDDAVNVRAYKVEIKVTYTPPNIRGVTLSELR